MCFRKGGFYTNVGMGLCVFIKGVLYYCSDGVMCFHKGGYLPSIVCGNVLWNMCTMLFHPP